MQNRSQKKATTAFHSSDSTIDVVGFGNLRVLIIEDDGDWFAQCQDLNYAAQGTSLEEVKLNFERGLAATVEEHLRIFGHIENLLGHAPSLSLRRQLMHKMPQRFRYSQVTVHQLPEKLQDAIQFAGIEFIRPVAA
jgi:predicted RNase H-like HicB family nuclease